MPLNESSRKPRRERHPVEFDLIGVPRSGCDREILMQQIQETVMNQPVNSFAVDKPVPVQAAMQNLTPEQQKMLKNLLDSFISGGQGREFDLSKPPVEPYRYSAFPMMVYHHTTGHVIEVSTEAHLQAAIKKGFQQSPSPNHDYSNVRNGVAAVKHAADARPVTLPADDLLADGPSDEDLAREFEAQPEAQSGAPTEVQEAEAAPSRRRR